MGMEKRYSILMLEDDHDDRHITESFFSERGYEIDIQFLDESDQLISYLEDAAIQGSLPNMILIDLNMPRKNGYEVLKEVKSHSQFHVIPVIIVSGTAFPADVKECYRLGANSFVKKPFTDQLTQKKIETFANYWFEVSELPEVQSHTNIAL